MGRQFVNANFKQELQTFIMKLVCIAAAGFGLANASMRSLLSNIQTYAQQNANKTGRAFTGVVENSFEPLNGYGCWCYLDDTWRDANHDLINSYKCIEMDAEANGINDCDAQAVAYTGFSFGLGADLTTECNVNNAGDECAQNACIVEGAFTLRYLSYMGIGKDLSQHPDYDASYVHTSKGGPFDPDVNCPGIPNPVGSDKECCGEHALLTRHPYRLYSGFTTRSCCSGEVINNELNQCCNNAVIDINDICN